MAFFSPRLCSQMVLMSQATAHCSRMDCTVARRMASRPGITAGLETRASRCADLRPMLRPSSREMCPVICTSLLVRMECCACNMLLSSLTTRRA
eukprot:12864824-Heterocapsa_arctica.AAC.2